MVLLLYGLVQQVFAGSGLGRRLSERKIQFVKFECTVISFAMKNAKRSSKHGLSRGPQGENTHPPCMPTAQSKLKYTTDPLLDSAVLLLVPSPVLPAARDGAGTRRSSFPPLLLPPPPSPLLLLLFPPLLPICMTTGPDLIRLKMAMASSWLRPWRMSPFTARISSPGSSRGNDYVGSTPIIECLY